VDDPFSQPSYHCRLEWGREGARRAAARGDLLVVVDVLSFSTTVATAVHHGGAVYPCPAGADPAVLARRVGAAVAVRREEVPARGRFSLSPLTCIGLEPGTRLVVASPNGATCSHWGGAVPCLFAAALVNASAVAAAVRGVMAATGIGVTVLACGERWETPGEDGPLRVAVEDYLGAGAVLAGLPGPKSPEAAVCAGASQAAAPDLPALLWDCGSSRELRARGYGDDVRHASRLDCYAAVPVLRDACFVPFESSSSSLP
jgi:2-phosphosulfolactate phosphatase